MWLKLRRIILFLNAHWYVAKPSNMWNTAVVSKLQQQKPADLFAAVKKEQHSEPAMNPAPQRAQVGLINVEDDPNKVVENRAL